ncbi:MAG: FkbM family methyltransferase [Halioglobus sp.]
MSLISYAQNLEDVVLWRALGNIEGGFYIDVGANDPVDDSVTKLFYDKGWTGINIEPIEQWHEKLELERPKDINLKVAAGDRAGELTIYDLPDTGLSTSDKATAERHEKDRGYSKNAVTVPLVTLTSICEKYSKGDIHFLKIDVEGAEAEVIRGMDLSHIRPWILVVEATQPNLPIEDFDSWEPILVEANYKFVYFDGLNRFYIADEKCQELAPQFSRPPNTFDGFELARVVQARADSAAAQEETKNAVNQAGEAERRAEDAEQKTITAVKRAEDAEQKTITAEKRAEGADVLAAEASANLEVLEDLLGKKDYELNIVHQSNHQYYLLSESQRLDIEALRKSVSWRVTAPLRLMPSFLQVLIAKLLHILRRAVGMPKRIFLLCIGKIVSFVINRPKLAARIAGILESFPRLRAMAYRIMYSSRSSEQLQYESESIDLPANQPVIAESTDTFPEGARAVGVGHANRSPLESYFR